VKSCAQRKKKNPASRRDFPIAQMAMWKGLTALLVGMSLTWILLLLAGFLPTALLLLTRLLVRVLVLLTLVLVRHTEVLLLLKRDNQRPGLTMVSVPVWSLHDILKVNCGISH
jgi:small-conductance mechanosensitive channel